MPKHSRRSYAPSNRADTLHNFPAFFLWIIQVKSLQSLRFLHLKFELMPMFQSQLIISLIVSGSRRKWKYKAGALVHVSDLKAAVRTVIRAFLIFIPRTRFGYRWRCWCLNHVLIPFLNAFIHLYSLLNLSMHPIVLIDDTLSFHLSPHQTSEEIKAANKWYYVKCHSRQRIVRDRTDYYMLRTYIGWEAYKIWYTYQVMIYRTKKFNGWKNRVMGNTCCHLGVTHSFCYLRQ